MDLNGVAMFVAVVRAGSLSAGAAQLAVPLATVSRRILALEKSMQVQLVERSARGIKVTEAGARLFEYAAKGLDWLSEGEVAVRTGQSELRGRLRLSIPPAFEPWREVIQGFQARYPEIRVSLQVTERRIDLVQDGVDVALRIGEVGDDSLIARSLFEFRHVIVAAPSLLELLGRPLTPQDLQRYPCAMWAAHSSSLMSWEIGGARIELAPKLTINDYHYLKTLALAGDVITELPEFLARPAVEDGSLQILFPDAPLPAMTAQLLYQAHRHPSSLVRAYLDYCTSEARRFFTPLERNLTRPA